MGLQMGTIGKCLGVFLQRNFDHGDYFHAGMKKIKHFKLFMYRPRSKVIQLIYNCEFALSD